jgi:FAD synthase
VHFKAKIRDEIRFANFEALQAQIKLDVQAAQQIFARLNL